MAEQGLMAYGQQVATPKKKKKKVAYITKKKKYTGKKYDTSALAAGQQVLTARKGRKDRGKKYGSAEAGELRRNMREEARKGRAKPRPFGDAFKAARSAGKDKFLWKGKSYHTKTKSELEKATGAKEKERFERAGKAKQVPVRKSSTFAADAKADRVRAKRIAWMEKRKAAGKSYSKKNLAALKAKS